MRSIIVTLLLSSQLDLSCNFSVRQLKGYSSPPLETTDEFEDELQSTI
jgi:hypothetical protein